VSAGGNGDRSMSWRRALAPGEDHGFFENPGWWDARDLPRDDDDVPRLRATLVRAFPPLPDGSGVLDLGAGTGTLVALLAGFYPALRYALIDASAAALARAERKLAAVAPELDVAFIAEAVDPTANEPLPGGPYRLATSSIALHDIAKFAASDDEA